MQNGMVPDVARGNDVCGTDAIKLLQKVATDDSILVEMREISAIPTDNGVMTNVGLELQTIMHYAQMFHATSSHKFHF